MSNLWSSVREPWRSAVVQPSCTCLAEHWFFEALDHSLHQEGASLQRAEAVQRRSIKCQKVDHRSIGVSSKRHASFASRTQRIHAHTSRAGWRSCHWATASTRGCVTDATRASRRGVLLNTTQRFVIDTKKLMGPLSQPNWIFVLREASHMLFYRYPGMHVCRMRRPLL